MLNTLFCYTWLFLIGYTGFLKAVSSALAAVCLNAWQCMNLNIIWIQRFLQKYIFSYILERIWAHHHSMMGYEKWWVIVTSHLYLSVLKDAWVLSLPTTYQIRVKLEQFVPVSSVFVDVWLMQRLINSESGKRIHTLSTHCGATQWSA